MLYESIIWKYIYQEEELLTYILNNHQQIYFEENINRIYIVAHGSSYNAAISTKLIISKLCNIEVQVFTPDNFISIINSLSLNNDCLLIGISQTGTSSGVLNALRKVKNICRIFAITALKGSAIDQLADKTIYLECGEEDSNAKTKGYSATLLKLMLFGVENAYKQRNIDKNKYDEILKSLKDEVSVIKKITKDIKDWCESTKFGVEMANEYLIGSGVNYGTAVEGQLKMMETLRVPTMYNDILEFSHGMHRAINNKSYLILINSGNDEARKIFVKTYEYMRRVTEHCVMINVSKTKTNDSNIIDIPLFEFDDSLLLTTLVIQVISTFVPEINNMDPNGWANDDYTKIVATRI